MTALPEVFRCTALSCTLTRSGCGDRHLRAKNNGRTPGARVNDRAIFAAACRDCEIGAAHARGERPDVMIASLTARREDDMARGQATMITHQGETKPLAAWAKEAGMATETLRKRLAKDLPMRAALTLPVKRTGRPQVETPSKAAAQKRAERARRPIGDAVRLGKSIERAQARARAMVAPPSGPGILEGDGDGRGPEALSGLAATLARLGYVVEDAGLVPAGRLLLVRSEARA